MNRHVKKLFDTLPETQQTDEVKKALKEALHIGGNLCNVIEDYYGGDEMGGGTGFGPSKVAFSGTFEECEQYIEDNGGRQPNYSPDGAKYTIQRT